MMRVKSINLEWVQWANPDENDDFFRGWTDTGYGKDRSSIDHRTLRIKYPKMIGIRFGPNNKENEEIAVYLLRKAEECALESLEFRRWSEEQTKKKRR